MVDILPERERDREKPFNLLKEEALFLPESK